MIFVESLIKLIALYNNPIYYSIEHKNVTFINLFNLKKYDKYFELIENHGHFFVRDNIIIFNISPKIKK